jgi:hypothetical protein
MYNYLFDLKNEQFIEQFGINIPKKKYSDNTNINTSLMISSLTKITTNVSNNVMQSNIAKSSNALGAINSIFLSGIECDTINVSGIRQIANANLQSTTQVKQQSTSNISTDVSTNISKEISKSTDMDLKGLKADNDKAYNDFLNKNPGLEKLKCGYSLFASSKCKGLNYSLDQDIKRVFNLDLDVEVI